MQKNWIGNETKDKNSLVYNLLYSRSSINSMTCEVLAEYYVRACQERCGGLKIKNWDFWWSWLFSALSQIWHRASLLHNFSLPPASGAIIWCFRNESKQKRDYVRQHEKHPEIWPESETSIGPHVQSGGTDKHAFLLSESRSSVKSLSSWITQVTSVW